MNPSRNLRSMLSALVLGVTAMGACAQAAQLNYGTYFKATHNIIQDAVKPYLDGVTAKTRGAVTFKYLTDGTVVGASTTAKGVQQGLVDMGTIIPTYSSAMWPTTGLLNNLPSLKNNSLIETGVINELFFLHCEQCQREWAAAKILPMAMYASSPYYLQCAKELHGLEDLKGKRIQGTGKMIGGFVVATGGLSVGLTVSELYTGISQGTLDCFIGAVSWLDTYGLKDVIKFAVDAPLGVFRPVSQMNMNLGKWNRLSKDEQQAFIDGIVRLVADSAYGYMREHQTAYDSGVAAGIQFVPPFAGFEEAFENVGKEIGQQFLELAQKSGVKNPQDLLDRYLALEEQWREIVANTTSQAAYEQALHERIFSKVKWPGQ